MSRTSAKILAIKKAVRERDGLCCTECGITNEQHKALTGRQLDVHRVVPGSLYSLEGCVTLCNSCHKTKPISLRVWGSGTRLADGSRQISIHPDFAARALKQAARFAITLSAYVSIAIARQLEADEASDPNAD